MNRFEIPFATSGQKIGLLGGSFDPAHEGHLHVTRTAIRCFGLDRVWWLVSPGNPLKDRGPAPLADRMAFARHLVDHRKVEVTDIEARLGTFFTAQTLTGLFRLYPSVRFTWLMGEDNLAQFHRWKDWEWIASQLPIGVIARPLTGHPSLNSRLARRFRQDRLTGQQSHLLAGSSAPSWCFVNAPHNYHSSTLLRARGDWPNQ